MDRTKGKWEPVITDGGAICVQDLANKFLIAYLAGKPRDVSIANADFICLAVNNHDELVEALELAVHCMNSESYPTSRIEELEALLAKVEGQ